MTFIFFSCGTCCGRRSTGTGLDPRTSRILASASPCAAVPSLPRAYCPRIRQLCASRNCLSLVLEHLRAVEPRHCSLPHAPRRVRSKWWEAQTELWVTVHTEEDFWREVSTLENGQEIVLVDWYATWCKSCRAVYPLVCVRAADKQLRKRVKFVKVRYGGFGPCASLLGSAAQAVLWTQLCVSVRAPRPTWTS